MAVKIKSKSDMNLNCSIWVCVIPATLGGRPLSPNLQADSPENKGADEELICPVLTLNSVSILTSSVAQTYNKYLQ